MEDPIVAQLLQTNEPERGPQWTHVGVTCDRCSVCPVVGVRWKSLAHDDYDVFDSCRRSHAADQAAKAARVPGFHVAPTPQRPAFVRIAHPDEVLRHALAVFVRWWPLFARPSPLPASARQALDAEVRGAELYQAVQAIVG